MGESVGGGNSPETRAVFDNARRNRSAFLNTPRLRGEMAAAGADAVVASSQANVIYTSGAYLPIDVVPTFVVTTAAGDRAIVVNEADAEFVRAFAPELEDVRSFRYGHASEEDALRLLTDVLNELGAGRGSIGVEVEQLPASRLDRLTAALPGARWLDSGPIFQRTRLIKTDAELDVLRAAARATTLAIADAFAASGSAETEKQLAAQIQANALLAGADDLSHTNVNAGVNSTLGHSISLDAPIASQDVIHVDFGAVFGGYFSDVSRNAAMGAPDEGQRDIYARLLEIHLTLLGKIGPGVSSSEIFEWGEREFERAGLKYPWGTIGHSIGLAMHEGFEMSADSDTVLEPGMVVCVEPSHIEPGDARYDIEDMVAILEDGIEVLSVTDDTSRMYEIA